MQARDAKNNMFELSVTCGMNVRYHQAYEDFWGKWDRAVKVAVVILTVIGLLFSVPDFVSPVAALIVGIISATVALVLNVINFGDWEKEHAKMFRLWSDLRSDAELMEFKIASKEEGGTIQPHLVERIAEIRIKANNLHAAERMPNHSFLHTCYHDELRYRRSSSEASVAAVETVESESPAGDVVKEGVGQ